jgi:hypothetical protein
MASGTAKEHDAVIDSKCCCMDDTTIGGVARVRRPMLQPMSFRSDVCKAFGAALRRFVAPWGSSAGRSKRVELASDS